MARKQVAEEMRGAGNRAKRLSWIKCYKTIPTSLTSFVGFRVCPKFIKRRGIPGVRHEILLSLVTPWVGFSRKCFS